MTLNRIDLATTDFSDISSGEALPIPLPGDVLRLDFLEPMGITAYALAQAITVPANRVTGILHGTRAITADTALKLAARFDNSAEFWMNLQTNHDLAVAREAVSA